MLVDKKLTFSDAQAITAAAASTDVLDFSEARDLGVGEPLYIVVLVDTAFTDSGSNSTLSVALETDSSESFTPDATRTLFTFPALSAAGTVKISRIGPDDINQRYCRLYYTPNNGDLTTGAVTAFITHDIQAWKAYADNITIQ